MDRPRAPCLRVDRIGRRRSSGGWLFNDIDFTLSAGDRLALVGPTGSGKSLILRATALLDPVDTGRILWRGQMVKDAAVPRFRSRVVYLQQRSPVIEGTVEDNLQMPFHLHLRQEVSFPRDRAVELLTRLGRSGDFLTSRAANLSGGERQIVALLRALLVTPEVLLLDEPTAALDPEASATLESMVETWFDESPDQRAYFWVTHDQAQAERVGRRTMQLRDGRLETP